MTHAIKILSKKQSQVILALYTSKVSCGFTSPVENYSDHSLSLDDHLIPHPHSTFLVRASGDSMKNAGIFDQDLLIVDRSIITQHNHIVLAVLYNEFTVKRFIQQKNAVILQADNPLYPNITVSKEDDFFVWGVIIHVIHSYI